MNDFTYSDGNFTFNSSNPDLQEVWHMQQNAKKHLKDVEQKLEQVRKSIYLPSKNGGDTGRISSPSSSDDFYRRPRRKTDENHFIPPKKSTDFLNNSNFSNVNFLNSSYEPPTVEKIYGRTFPTNSDARNLLEITKEIGHFENNYEKTSKFSVAARTTTVGDVVGEKPPRIFDAETRKIIQNGAENHRNFNNFNEKTSRKRIPVAKFEEIRTIVADDDEKIHRPPRVRSLDVEKLRKQNYAIGNEENSEKSSKISEKSSKNLESSKKFDVRLPDAEKLSENEKTSDLISSISGASSSNSTKEESPKKTLKKRSVSTKNFAQNEQNAPLKKTKTYDAEEIRKFMAKKKKERKQEDEERKKSKNSTGNIEKIRHYDQEEMKNYVHKQKQQRKTDEQRVKEKMERAKIAQQENLQRAIVAQRALRNVPLVTLILNANSFTKQTSSGLTKEEYINLIREKYKNQLNNVENGASSSEFEDYQHPTTQNVEIDVAPSRPVSLINLNGFHVNNHENSSTPSFDRAENKDAVNVRPRLQGEQNVNPENRRRSKEIVDHRRSSSSPVIIDQHNIINTVLRKRSNFRNEDDQTTPLSIDKGRRPPSVPRLVLYDTDEEDVPAKYKRALSPIVLPIRRSPFSSTSSSAANVGRVSSSSESVDKQTSPNEPSPSISSLTLFTDRRSVESAEAVETRQQQQNAADEIVVERRKSFSSDEHPSSGGVSSTVNEVERVSPTTLQMQVVAGLNYLHFVQDSMNQVAAVDRLNVLASAHQNAAAFGQLVQSDQKNQQLQKDLQQIRLNTERQRAALDAEMALAEERRTITAEMSANQRRLLDIIVETNQRMAADRERSAENVARLAAEAATTAATSAVLAALRGRGHVDVSPNASSSQKSFADSSTSTLETDRNEKERSSERSSSSSKHKKSTSPVIDYSDSFVNTSNDVPLENKNQSATIETLTIDEERKKSIAEEVKSNSSFSNDDTSSVPTALNVDERPKSSSTPISDVVTAKDSSKSNSISTQASLTIAASETKSIATQIDDETKSLKTVESQTVDYDDKTKTETIKEKINASKSVSTATDEGGIYSSSFQTKSVQTSTSKNDRRRSSSVEESTEELTTSRNSSSKEAKTTTKVLHQFLNDSSAAGDELRLSPSSLSVSDLTLKQSRIHALKTDLKERKETAEKLKHEYKRRTKERFLVTEQSLMKQIKSYDEYIEQAQLQLKDLERVETAGGAEKRASTPPKIMSPRTSDETTTSPRRSKLKSPVHSSSSARSSPTTSRANSEEKTPRAPLKSAEDDDITTAKSAEEEKSSAKKSTSKSEKIVVPKLDLLDLNDDRRAAKKEREISSRKQSLDVETTEEVSDVPEDVEDEEILIVETNSNSKTTTNNNYSEDFSSHESPQAKTDERNSVDDEKSSTQRKEQLLASVLTNFVSDGVDECLKMWREKEQKFGRRTKNDVEKTSIEKLCDEIFDEFLTDAIRSCVRVALFQMTNNAAVISRTELGRVLELTKPTSPAASPRSSPRSPSLDKYVSEIYREPPVNQTRKDSPPASPRSVDVPRLETDEIYDEEQWMDDDFGLDESPKKSASSVSKLSPKSPRNAVGELKFTTDVFSAVPSTIGEICAVVECCVGKIYDQRRYGERMSDATRPRDLYAAGRSKNDELDLSLNRESDAAFRDFLFDYCKEIVADIYDDAKNEDEKSTTGWKKPQRLKLSAYSKFTPKNVDDLKLVVDATVKTRLSLTETRKTGRENVVARKKLDKIDEILLPEMYREEPDWTNYDDEELKVKFELADSVWKIVLDDCLSSQISLVLKREVLLKN